MNIDPNNSKIDRLEVLLVAMRRTIFSNAHGRRVIPSSAMSLVKILADYYTEHSTPITVGELANRAGLSLSATSQHLDVVEKRMRIIKRRSADTDKRVSEIVLTKRGQMMLSHMNKRRNHSRVLHELIDYLGPNDSDELLRLLGRIDKFNNSRNQDTN